MPSLSAALRDRLAAARLPSTIRAAVDDEGALTVEYLDGAGTIEHVVQAHLGEREAAPDRIEAWSEAFARVLARPREQFYSPLECVPALVGRLELASVEELERAMLDDGYCQRAEEAERIGGDLAEAITAGNELAARDALDRDPAAPPPDLDGWLPLHLAVSTAAIPYGSSEPAAVVRLFLGRGADPSARCSFEGLTPLHVTLPEHVPLLRDAGASLDARDDAGRTPAERARLEGNEELLQALSAD